MSDLENQPDTIDVPVWYSNGSMMVRRDALDTEHPESTYNWLLNNGHVPEDYGYFMVQLTEEQKELLQTIPDQALARELRLRENCIVSEEMYGGR